MWDSRAEDGVPQACLEMVSSFIDEAADDQRLGKCLIGFEIRFYKLTPLLFTIRTSINYTGNIYIATRWLSRFNSHTLSKTLDFLPFSAIGQ